MLFDAPAMPQQNGSKEAKERGSFGKIYTYKVGPVLMPSLSFGRIPTSCRRGLIRRTAESPSARNPSGRDIYWAGAGASRAAAGKRCPGLLLELEPAGKDTDVCRRGWTGVDGVYGDCPARAVTNEDSTTTLLGSTSLDFVQIIRWISFTNTDVVNRMAAWVRPLIGYTPYSKEKVLKAQRETTQAIRVFEDNLRDRKYLVGDRLTLADIMCASLLSFGFAQIFDREWREDFPYFSGWYMMVMHLPIMKAVVDEVPFVEVGLPNAPPTEPFKAP